MQFLPNQRPDVSSQRAKDFLPAHPSRHPADPSHPRQSRLLLVDSSPERRRSIALALEELGHEQYFADTTAEALDILSQQTIDLVLLDQFVQGIGAANFCRLLKSLPNGASLPVLVFAPAENAEAEISAMEAGADAFLTAPLRPKVLRATVQGRLRHKCLIDSLNETESVLFTLAQSIEERDPALRQHCERLALMAAAMGLRLGLSAADIQTLQRGGYLHDIGKIGLPDQVLLKPGPLTPEEWEIMRSHAERGEKICLGVRSLAPVLPIIRHHHERWDGSGYPDQLTGEHIPLLARILQLADIYDALLAVRPYKAAFTPEEALQIIKDEARKGWRDPNLVAVLEEIVPMFQPGVEYANSSLRALGSSIERFRNLSTSKGTLSHADYIARLQSSPFALVSGL